MMALDRELLECDLAETYGIYDMKGLPPSRVALFSYNLRDSSRIKMKVAGLKVPLDTLLMAQAVDCLRTIIWMNSKGANSSNRPKPIADQFIDKQKEEESETFESGEDFKAAWNSIVERTKDG